LTRWFSKCRRTHGITNPETPVLHSSFRRFNNPLKAS
jgi:hypothetical protein